MKLVSVIIPVYNVEKFLRRCLNSVVNQSFQDYEIICINDCSPDNSQAILDEYADRYPDLVRVIVNEKNMGLGKTRERGIAEAEADYIMFIDSDDYIKRDFVETYYNRMMQDHVDIVIGGYVRDVAGKLSKHFVSDSIWSVVTYPIACAKMFRKNFLLENGIHFSEIRCGEDIYFSMDLFYHDAKYSVMDYCGYFYYFNQNSITGAMNYKKNHEEFVSSIYQEFIDKHEMNKLSQKKHAVIEYAYICNMVNALITYGHGGGIRRMNRKRKFWIRDMEEKFPDYRKNPYVGLLRPKGQTLKIRIGVGVIMRLHKLHLDWLLLDLISLV